MKLIYDDREFDSREECQFYQWCVEAQEKGIINKIIYHPISMILSDRKTIKIAKHLKTKTKVVDQFLLNSHEYTPDFILESFNPIDFFHYKVDCCTPHSRILYHHYIEVKGGFDRFHSEREFSINQKWVYDKYGIFINKVIPKKLFEKTWKPTMKKIYQPRPR